MLNNKLGFGLIITSVISLSLAVIFQWLPYQNLITNGPYAWHIQQPQFREGGIELLVVFLIFTLLIWLFKNKMSTVGILLISALFLRLHQGLVAALVALLYFEIIISFGRWLESLFLKRIKKNKDTLNAYLEWFIIGLIGWTILALLMSLLGHGRFSDLRWLTGFVGIVSLTKGLYKPFCWQILKNFMKLPKTEKWISSFIWVVILAMFAKANIVVCYDSIWYGLRPENVLIGPNSFFDHLGYTFNVYYYPKLFELFLLPISNLSDYNFIYSGNIYFLILLFITIYSFLKSFKINTKWALIGVALIATIPVVSNFAVTAKPDIFVTFLMLFGAFNFWKWIENKKNKHFWLGLSAVALCFGSKYTSFAYGPFLVLGAIMGGIKSGALKIFISNLKKLSNNQHVGVLIGSILVVIGISYRTYVLTGYPFWILRSLWDFLGFEIKYPLASYGYSVVNDFFGFKYLNLETANYLYGVLFNPSEFGHIIMAWFGNSVLYLFIIMMCLFLVRKIKIRKYSAKLLLLLPIILIGLHYLLLMQYGRVAGGDSNYYLIPLIFSIVLFYTITIRAEISYRKILLLPLVIFIIGQSFFMFMMHPSWSTGAEPFDFDLSKPIIETIDRNIRSFEANGLPEIANYINENGTDKNALLVNSDIAHIAYRLPCRVDNFSHLVMRTPLLKQMDEFLEYLSWAGIDYIIYPTDYIDNPCSDSSSCYIEGEYDLIQSLINNEEVLMIEDRNFHLLDISPLNNDFNF